MSENCIFCKIAKKQIPTEFVCETDNIFVINDLHPKAKTHLLVMPKAHYENLNDLDDAALMGELLQAVKAVTKKLGIKDYQLRINNGKSAGQEVFHLHIHVLSNE